MLHSCQPNNLDKNRNYIYNLVTLDFSPGTKGCPRAIYHPFRGLHPSKTLGLHEMEPITRAHGRDLKKKSSSTLFVKEPKVWWCLFFGFMEKKLDIAECKIKGSS
jgi:hypothetical protein